MCTAPEMYYLRDPAKFGGVRGLTKDARFAVGIVGADMQRSIVVACGKCMECRLARARDWSLRSVHEASLYDDNCFITLTYDDEHLPLDHGLHYEHFQAFMHRLRKRMPGAGRFLMCGEYGDQFGRPHFHAILFNCGFSDKVLIRSKPDPLYSSELLSDIWHHQGVVSLGDVTTQSAGYVARYSTKKIYGPGTDHVYDWIDPMSGEVFKRATPFLHSSNRPGIGAEWFNRWHADVFPCDEIVFDGRSFPVPRYYTKLYEALDKDAHGRVSRHRRAAARDSRFDYDKTGPRLFVKAEIERLKGQSIKRDKGEL
ncbi:replication initiator protein [Blackfly microvirus SF02]|uniref:Replication initiator protein n=1 Tax=Blackfly microvirus SF02 TaxID=2576452 RepID=A0A4P8PKL8_9VIRU|nr:replication initiator protein [Blackfly microvirus SF02]